MPCEVVLAALPTDARLERRLKPTRVTGVLCPVGNRNGEDKSDVQGVAGGTDGADGVYALFGGEGATQAADVDVDGARLDIDVGAPDGIEQLLAREDTAGVLHEVVEQPELGRA